MVHPPIRTQRDQDALWDRIFDSNICVIGTDDCAFTREQKKVSEKSYEIPGGMPGIETQLSVMLEEGVNNGRISMSQFASITSTNPAKIYGIYPQKGAVQIGRDADFVIIDRQKDNVIHTENLHGMADWTPFEGLKVKGCVDMTVSRGEIIVDNGTLNAQKGRGQFLKRRTSKAGRKVC